MTWISLDCRLPDHPKMALLPNDAARYGWIVVLLRAKEQRTPGTFASESHFREVLGRHSKSLPFYKEAGLLEDNEDGALTVHGWKQYQWAATKQRQREDIPKTNNGHEKDSRAGNVVPVPVDVSTEEGMQGEKPIPPFPLKGMNGEAVDVVLSAQVPVDFTRLQKLAEELTGLPYALPNAWGGYGQKVLNEQLPLGYDRVERAWRSVANRTKAEGNSKPTLRQLVLGADDLLNPIPTGSGVSKEAVEEEERARFDRRVQATQRRMRGMTGEPTDG